MATFRVNKNKNYTIMSNYHLKDRSLSLKAKGLLSIMLSLPENWDYSINGLVAICLENETAIKSALNELKKYGYLIVTKLKPNESSSGRFEYIYNIYEQPHTEKQAIEKQGLENLPLENQGLENQGQYITKELNTNKLNKDKENKEYKEEAKPQHSKFIKPTLEEVKAYCLERKNNIDAETFIDYYTANGWQVGKRPMKDWRAAVRTWEHRNKPKEQPKNKNDFDFVSEAIQQRQEEQAKKINLDDDYYKNLNF